MASSSERTADVEPGEAGTSNDKSVELTELDPFITFSCGICRLTESCLFGKLKCADGHYASDMFFMRDPFAPPVRVKGKKPVLSDFLVLGSTCTICGQAICISPTCSIYFGGHFCTTCIVRERRRFPEKVLEMVAKSQTNNESEQLSK